MSIHKFRIRFELSPDDRLHLEGERLEFDLGAPIGQVEFIGRSDEKSVSTATELIVRSRSGYASSEVARAYGEIVARALFMGAVRERLGIDLGKEGPKGFLTAYGKQLLAQQMGFDGNLVDDQPGLLCYEDSGNTRFAKFGPARAIVGRPLTRFLNGVRDSLADAQHLSSKSLLGLELYNASKFEHSLRTRFLSLITVVEVLAERPIRQNVALALVQQFADTVRSAALATNERDQLLRAARDLELESIGGACRGLVAEHVGSAESKEFRDWYNARSSLVHTGATTLDLPSVLDRVDKVVAQLLLSVTRVAT